MTTGSDHTFAARPVATPSTRRRAGGIAGVLAALALVAGCSGDGPISDITLPPDASLPDISIDPGPDPTEAPAPEPTAAPEPEPEPEPTAAPEAPTDTTADDATDDDSSDEVVVIILVVLAIAVVIGLVAWLARRSGDRSSGGATPQQLASISSRSRWVHDHGIPQLLAATDPASIQSAWMSLDSTLSGVQQELLALPKTGNGEEIRALTELETAIAQTHGSVDSWYQLRTQRPDQPDAIRAAEQSLHAQRAALLHAIGGFDVANA